MTRLYQPAQTNHNASRSIQENIASNGVQLPAVIPVQKKGEKDEAPSQGTDPRQERQLPNEPWNVTQQQQRRISPVVQQQPVIQTLSIHDRNWDEATAVQHLSKAAYIINSGNGSLVLKYHPQGKIEYDLSKGESPVTEAAAAKLGEIEELGVKTAGTVLIKTDGDEGQHIIGKLKTLGSAGADLANSLLTTEAFLVMEHAPGEPLSHFNKIQQQLSKEELAVTFKKLGRLWTFDVMLDNTDRFFNTNLGNVIIGPGGSVYGIDQVIFMGATNIGKETGLSIAKADNRLGNVIDPEKRRKYSKEMFDSLKAGGIPDHLEALFVLNFEDGLLSAIIDAAGLNPKQLSEKLGELPDFAARAAAEMGVGGIIDVLALFQKIKTQVQVEHANLANEKIARNSDLAIIGDLSAERRVILNYLYNQMDQLYKKHEEVNKWFTGKSNYWKSREGDLVALGQYRQAEYFERRGSASSKADKSGSKPLKGQIESWTNNLLNIWSQIGSLTNGIKDTKEIGDRINELKILINKEIKIQSIPETV